MRYGSITIFLEILEFLCWESSIATLLLGCGMMCDEVEFSFSIERPGNLLGLSAEVKVGHQRAST